MSTPFVSNYSFSLGWLSMAVTVSALNLVETFHWLLQALWIVLHWDVVWNWPETISYSSFKFCLFV